MSLAAEHFKALTEETDIKNIKDADEAAAAMRKLFGDTQALTLSQINDSTARQLGSILFSHEAGLIAALGTVNPPEVKIRANNAASKNAFMFAASLLIALAACAVSWKGGDYILAVLLGAAEIIAGFGVFWPKKAPTVEVKQTLNTEALVYLAERRMEAIDRDLEAFLNLPAGDADSDDGVLHLITKTVALKREDPDSVPDELMTAITALTISRGYTLLEYTDDAEPFFDIMPTVRDTRTIVPAVLKGDRLISRGMAIAHIEDEKETERV